MTAAELRAIVRRLAAATNGPLQWIVHANGVTLSTVNRGRVYVMGFARLGMRGAQPTFQVHNKGCDGNCRGCGVMVPVMEIVGEKDHNGYATLDHPDANLFAHATTDIAALLELLREILELALKGSKFTNGCPYQCKEILSKLEGLEP